MRIAAWLALLSYLCAFNCSRDYPIFEKVGGRFPLTVGNEWRLSGEYRIEFYRGTPPGFENPWVKRYSIHWQIVHKDVLDGHRSYVLKNEWYQDGGEGFSLHWYTDSWEGSSGLYNIGYSGAGAVDPPKLPEGYGFEFAGQKFSSSEEILDWIVGVHLSKEDTILRIPPERVLEYPLEVGREWIAFVGLFGPVRRKVVDREPVTTNAGTFYCYEVEVTIEFTELLLREPLIYYEWFSNEGLVKRWICITGQWTDPYGNPQGTYEMTDIYLLENYSIKH